MAWSIIIMTDLVCEEVLSVLTHVTSRRTKKGWQQLGNLHCACVVRIGARIRVEQVPWQLLDPTQPIPTVQPAIFYEGHHVSFVLK